MSASQTLANVTRGEWDHYLQQFGPLEESLIKDRDSTALIQQAKQDVALQNDVAEGSFNRDMSRYGVNANGAQTAQIKRMRALGESSNVAQATNTARIDQRERNMALMSELMQQGRGLASGAYSGLSTAASSEASRNATNAQNKAVAKNASRAGFTNAIGTGLAVGMATSSIGAGLGAAALAFI